MQHKIKAFSLIELLVVLAISAIVVSIGYVSYIWFSTYYLNQLSQYNNAELTYTLTAQFELDLFNTELAILHEDSLILQSSKDTLVYLYTKDTMFRLQNSTIDSFNIVFAPSYFFENKRTYYGLIDQIKWNNYDSSFITFSKINTAKNLTKYNH